MKYILWIVIFIGIIIAASFILKNNLGQPLSIQHNSSPISTVPQVSSNTSNNLEVFVRNVSVPWSIVFTSPTRMLFTERGGRISVVENGKPAETPIHTFPAVISKGEEGLMGMTIDPNYASNHFVYVSYAVPSGKTFKEQIVRFTDSGDKFTDEKTILDGIPAAQIHAGSRIKFGPDGKLYITTGDASQKDLAQNLSSLAGKILRINADGTIPSDNPFPNSPIWSYGHRNPQGIDWYPGTVKLYETEHGPSGFDGPGGGDEVNLIEKGKNYGWPLVSHEETKPGTVAPLAVYTPAAAPASGMFYTGSMFPEFKNNFFFGLLKGEGIMRVIFDPDNPTKVVTNERIPNIDLGRIREIVQGPDGAIYFSTSNTDGRGTPKDGDDKIYRLYR